MADPRHPDKSSNRDAKASRANRDAADTDRDLDAADDGEVLGADVANVDRDLDPGGVDLDTEEAEDIGAAAERLSTSGDLDEELSEELGVDNIVGPLEAGLGGGLDQAEEARAGITDEEIAKKTRRR